MRRRPHRAVTRWAASTSRSAGQGGARGLKPQGLIPQGAKPFINVLDLSVNKLRQAFHLSLSGSTGSDKVTLFVPISPEGLHRTAPLVIVGSSYRIGPLPILLRA
jgi:hypothetical protein